MSIWGREAQCFPTLLDSAYQNRKPFFTQNLWFIYKVKVITPSELHTNYNR